MLERVKEALEGMGLKVNGEKTEYMGCKWVEEKEIVGEAKVEGQVLRRWGIQIFGALM